MTLINKTSLEYTKDIHMNIDTYGDVHKMNIMGKTFKKKSTKYRNINIYNNSEKVISFSNIVHFKEDFFTIDNNHFILLKTNKLYLIDFTNKKIKVLNKDWINFKVYFSSLAVTTKDGIKIYNLRFDNELHFDKVFTHTKKEKGEWFDITWSSINTFETMFVFSDKPIKKAEIKKYDRLIIKVEKIDKRYAVNEFLFKKNTDVFD